MKERVLSFGTGNILVGVLCEPDSGQARAGAPAILLSNVGMNHRVGPNRIWVDLARQLAALGFTSLRYDQNGQGDSQPRRLGGDDQARIVLDMREAADLLAARKGLATVVPIGLCSGVDPAHRLAAADQRVAGAVFIDGYKYPTWRSLLHRRLGMYLDPRVLRRGLLRRLPKAGGAQIAEAEQIYLRDEPTRERMASDLHVMVGRGAKLLFIYTGEEHHLFNRREQFFEMLRPARFEGLIEVDYARDADHIFTLVPARRWLIARISSWLDATFPAALG